MPDSILLRGARLHNLKNLTLSIPKNQFVVLTGLSGSGKSTLGFDILLKEGQRQYLEALGLLPLGMAKAPVDFISGLSPSISLSQHLTNHSPRSTVGTSTDVYTYLRLLFARLGRRPCPACGQDIPPAHTANFVALAAEGAADPAAASLSSAPDSGDALDDDAAFDDEASSDEMFPCPHCGAPVAVLNMAHFSFNKPAGACPACTGLGYVQQPDLKRLVDEEKSLPAGAVFEWEARHADYQITTLEAAARYYGFVFDASLPIKAYSAPARDLLYFGVESPLFRRHFPALEPPGTVRQGRFEGLTVNLMRRYAEHLNQHQHEADYHDQLEEMLVTQVCSACGGARLRPESRQVTVYGQEIVALARLPLTDLAAWLKALPAEIDPSGVLAGPLLRELNERLARLIEVGCGYLTLARPSPDISAGEAQRLRLASLLASPLSGVLYVFDEPTIGLHQRDTRRLINVLRRLRDLGNTVLVIEHDLETIAAADYVIDFGPGAGKHGGQVVAAGSPAEIAAHPTSLTGAYLSGRLTLPIPPHRRPPGEKALTICGARHHNLQNLTVRLPLGLLIAVTGVSGSGKSSLIFDVLERALRQRLYGAAEPPGEHDALQGCEHLSKVVSIDQAQIGRLPRSNAATYTDIFTPIREAFAATPEARRLGLTARHFSFNLPGGRCERCQGAGVLTVKMHFMPEVEVRCPACQGRRFTGQTLAVQYRGLDISQALDLTIEEALALFQDIPAARSRLSVLSEVGLGYLQLGQPAVTLSGGEAQRVKLAKELGAALRGRAGREAARTLYLLDEPTTGLHLADTACLLGLLQRLAQAGSTVIVVEHNLELVKAADWVIDLGPEGGAGGGQLIAQGTPEQIAQTPGSHTGQCLRSVIQ